MDDRSSPQLRRVGNWLTVAVLVLFVASLAYMGAAWIVVFGVAVLLGWRHRDDWLKD